MPDVRLRTNDSFLNTSESSKKSKTLKCVDKQNYKYSSPFWKPIIEHSSATNTTTYVEACQAISATISKAERSIAVILFECQL